MATYDSNKVNPVILVSSTTSVFPLGPTREETPPVEVLVELEYRESGFDCHSSFLSWSQGQREAQFFLRTSNSLRLSGDSWSQQAGWDISARIPSSGVLNTTMIRDESTNNRTPDEINLLPSGVLGNSIELLVRFITHEFVNSVTRSLVDLLGTTSSNTEWARLQMRLEVKSGAGTKSHRMEASYTVPENSGDRPVDSYWKDWDHDSLQFMDSMMFQW